MSQENNTFLIVLKYLKEYNFFISRFTEFLRHINMFEATIIINIINNMLEEELLYHRPTNNMNYNNVKLYYHNLYRIKKELTIKIKTNDF